MASTQYLDRERSKSLSYDQSKKSISSDDYNNYKSNNNQKVYGARHSHNHSNISSSSNIGNSSNVSSSSSSSYNHNKVYGTNNHHYFNTRRHKKFTSINNTNGAGSSTSSNSSNDNYYNKENTINGSTSSTSISSMTHSTPTSNTNAPINNPTPANATSPNKSRMKRLSLTVSISTQMYLEKMGKASSSGVDSEDIKKMKNILSELKKDCKTITKNGKNQMLILDKVTNNFGESIQEFGNGMLKNCEEGEALRILGEQISEFDQSMKEGHIGCLGQFLEPLNEFYDEELKKARELKRKQNLVRIRYEQSQTNLIDVKKKNDTFANKTLQAKSDLEECKKSYNSVTTEFYQKMVENEKNFKLEIRKQIRDYVAMQVEFYREALENWEEFAEEMDEIIPPTADEIQSQEEALRKKLEAGDDDEDDEENDDDLLADL